MPYEKEHMERVLAVLRDFAGVEGRELGDGDVHELLNASYPAELQQRLRGALVKKKDDLTRLFLESWQPFGLRDDRERRELERQWESLFDGEEVLPASLVEVARKEETVFARKRYLVPISAEQRGRYRPVEDEELGCLVIERPYGEDGLEL